MPSEAATWIWPGAFCATFSNLKATLRRPVADAPNVVKLSTKMKNKRDEILAQKEFLAAEALKVANEAIGYLQDQLGECSTRDLVSIFNAAVKAHRDIVSDIVALTEVESKSEKELAAEYSGKVDELLKRLNNQ